MRSQLQMVLQDTGNVALQENNVFMGQIIKGLLLALHEQGKISEETSRCAIEKLRTAPCEARMCHG